jgi:hypothetical protein
MRAKRVKYLITGILLKKVQQSQDPPKDCHLNAEINL